MATDLVAVMKDFIENLLTDHATAEQYAADPHGTLAAQGITEHDLKGLDMRQVVGQASASSNLPADTRSALQSYCSGGSSSAGGYTPPPPPPVHHSTGHQSIEQVMQHLNYVTYVTYKDDHSITETLNDSSTHIDQSTHVEVHGDNSGDISVDQHDANATGAGAVAGSGGTTVGATGDHSQAIGGANNGQANTGDGAVQVGPGGHAEGINTGVNTGINAGGDVENAVVGDHNQTTQVSGDAHGSVFDFGGGHVSNITGNDISDSAVSGNGDANNASHNTLGDGSAVAAGGSASGHYSDSHNTTDSHNVDLTLTHVETNTVDADHSTVQTEQGPGDAHQEVVPEHPHPVVLEPEPMHETLDAHLPMP